MTTTITTLRDITRDMDSGYRPRDPRPEAAAIDREIAAGCDCTVCGHHGLAYHPFIRAASGTQPRSYRAVVQCPNCGHCEEI